MGKVSVASTKQKPQHSPLYKDITSEGGKLRKTPRGNSKRSKGGSNNNGQDEEGFVDAAASRKILQLAREQQEEIDEEENAQQSNITHKYRFQMPEDSDEDDDEADGNSEAEDEAQFAELEDFDEQELEGDEEEEEEVNEEDAKLFEQYLNSTKSSNAGANFDGFGSYNLADKIMAEIEAKKAQLEEQNQAGNENEEQNRQGGGVMLPPKVIAAYTQIGQVLSTWTHGKLPKLFKIIPSLNNWEDVLYVTDPAGWSPNACYEATRLFVSNLHAKEAEKFVNMVLLDRFRDNIEEDESHHLNYHLYRALKKALYKPSAFFKGFLFPLVESGCSNREAMIAGSVLSKVSIPVLHSSVALSYLLNLDFNPAVTFFIKVLLEKKYALPYQTVDDLVFYFMKFRILPGVSTGATSGGAGADIIEDDTTMDGAYDSNNKKENVLPVVWHKAFLAFAQRYKNDITDDQRDFLLETVRQRFHKQIGPEIRRELLAGKPRMTGGIKETEPEMMDIF